ncbi:MAG TPA: endo-1,4-beta-xylanase [Bacteroidales bacterium]|nr:endo-1,4-beta-xylanase [Bacteroidales bacterium]
MNKNSLTFRIKIMALAILIITAAACSRNEPGLKDAFAGSFLIGTAMNAPQILGSDADAKPFIVRHFNSITAEDAMKWERIHPDPDRYDFTLADSMVSFGQQHDMFIVGHTLVWHSQTPDWVFQDSLGNPLTRDALLERMKDHIFTVVGHFKGKVKGWDVVNEAIDEDGSLRKTKWLAIIGEDYIQKAFEYAYEADPEAELYFNDYNNELPAKRAGVEALVKELQQKGIKIDGVGIQGHWHLDSPDLTVIDESISGYASLGMKVMITEMEVNVLPTPPEVYGADIAQQAQYLETLNPYPDGLPDSVQDQLTKRYADLFRVLLKNKDVVTRVTFWGVHDGYSWKNDWPIRGRTNYPLLFDRKYHYKPAYFAVIKEAGKAK